MQPNDPYQPPQPPYQPPTVVQPVVPAKSGNRTLFIVLGVVAGAVALCCVAGVGAFVFARGWITTRTEEPTSRVEVTLQPVSPGGQPPQSDSLNRPVGTAVNVTSGSNAFRIVVTSATWRDTNCEENEFIPPPEGRLLVLDVTIQVTKGTASVNPFFFEYADSDGVTGNLSIFDGCEPRLDSGNDLPAGTTLTGKIVFDVTGRTTGTVSYSDWLSGPAASWTITG
jgi:hypothetical protein